MQQTDLFVRAWKDGGRAPDHPLNKCCITSEAKQALSKLYCRGTNKYLWVVNPCTPGPSVACRDESQLRGGRHRHARTCWVAIGDSHKPREIIGLVNFRPHEAGGSQRGLNIAEAFLRLPDDWSADEVLLADERYLLALHTAILPQHAPGDNWTYPEPAKGRFARIPTVPFSSQWETSGVCAQASMFMVSLQMCLPDRGYTEVEGPFTLSCVAADYKQRTACTKPVLSDATRCREEEAKAEHKQYCMKEGSWRAEAAHQAFAITGLSFSVMKETLKSVLTCPWEVSYRGADRDIRKLVPIRYCADPNVMAPNVFRRVLESFLSSSIPLLVQVDLALTSTAAVPHRTDRHPLDDIHCVVVIGAKGLLEGSEDAKVLFHCPGYGPYRTASLRHFHRCARLPRLAGVGRGRKYPAEEDLEPRIEIIAPVPHHIFFAPLRVFSQLPDYTSGISDLRLRDELEKFILSDRDRIAEWRVRLLPEKKVWDAYFARQTATQTVAYGAGAKQWTREIIDRLLPGEMGLSRADRVMCLEVYEFQSAAVARRPKSVYFAYIDPEANPPLGYRFPFTGGFGVCRTGDSADVLLFQIRADGTIDPDSSDRIVQLDDVIARDIRHQEITRE